MLTLPLPQRPSTYQPGGIIAAARPLGVSVDEWRQGISLRKSCVTGSIAGGCSRPSFLPVQDLDGVAVFEPFNINTAARVCDPLSGDDIRLAAENDAIKAAGSNIASAFTQSPVGNPDIESDSIDITPLIPSGFAATMQGLIQEMVTCGQHEIVFHVPAGYETHLLSNDLIEWDAASGTYHAGPHLVIVDEYLNIGPGLAPPPVVDGSQVWIHATGPIYLEMDEARIVEHTVQPANTTAIGSERLTLLAFDSCCMFSAVAQVC